MPVCTLQGLSALLPNSCLPLSRCCHEHSTARQCLPHYFLHICYVLRIPASSNILGSSLGRLWWPQGSLETDLGLGTITHPIHMTSMDPECNSQFVEFQESITAPRPAGCSRTLLLAGHGLEPNREGVLVSQLAIYIERDVASHLQAWKGKPAQELAQDHGFFQAIIKAPVEKLVHANLLRGPAKGPHYGNLLVGAIRKRLTKQGTLGQAEEQTLEKIFHFFQAITHLGTSLLYAYPSPSHVTVTVQADGAGASLTVSSEALVSAMLDTVLGVDTLSPSTTAATVRGIGVWIN